MSGIPVRVAFINHTAEPGGGEIALLELILHLDTSRIYPIVILFSDGPLAQQLRMRADVHILPLSTDVLKANKDQLGCKSLLHGGNVFSSLLFIYRLQSLLQSVRPRVVYTNSLKADVLGGISGRLLGLPVIWHVRDRISEDYLPKVVALFFRGLARVIPNHIVANSKSTLLSLRLTSGLLDCFCRSRIIHDGVDVKKYERFDKENHNQPIIVGLIGRISPWKGQDVFIEAIRLIYQTYPDVRFQIIGRAIFGEADFERKILQLVEAYKLGNIIEITGFESDVPNRLGTLDIVVHASTIPEPFGQVIIEGMAAGKPVIATNGGGVPEIVIDGITGILVPMKDPVALAQAIEILVRDGVLRSRMGAAARRHVSDHFAISTTAASVQNLLVEMS